MINYHMFLRVLFDMVVCFVAFLPISILLVVVVVPLVNIVYLLKKPTKQRRNK